MKNMAGKMFAVSLAISLAVFLGILLELIPMDGYGRYIWSSFVLTLFIVLFCEWRARAHHHNVYREIEVRIKAVEDRL